MKEVLKTLRQNYLRQTDFYKLQTAYIVVAIVVLIGAGVVGLINYPLGQSMLFSAALAGLILVVNGIVWSLIETFVIKNNSEAQKKPTKK